MDNRRRVVMGSLLLIYFVAVFLSGLQFSRMLNGSFNWSAIESAAGDFWNIEAVSRRRPNSTECEQIVLRSAFNSVPRVPMTPPTKSACSMKDWIKGEWIRSDNLTEVYKRTGLIMKYQNPYQPDYTSTTHQPWLWEWRPNATACRDLSAFDPVRLCASLGNRSILFVGDSLQANLIAAFRHQLDAAERYRSPKDQRRCHNRAWQDEYEPSVVICPSGARLDYIRNDHLSLVDHTDLECGDRCFPWVQALGEYAVLVLNTGLHIVDIDLFDFWTRETVDYLRRRYRGRVVYRLASAGHQDCMEHARPWTPTQYDAMEAVHRPKPYRWHFVDSFNDIAWRWYSTLPDSIILDTDAFVRLRPDVHRSQVDCLHHVIPGPWDYAVRMLYHVLVGDFSDS